MSYVSIPAVMQAVPTASTFIFIGRRGVGKSYAPEVYCIEDAVYRNRHMVVVGRLKEDILPPMVRKMFAHIFQPNIHLGGQTEISRIMAGTDRYPRYERYDLLIRSGEIWIAGLDSNDKPVKICLLGYTAAVQQAERFKRGTYPTTYNIFFDEFITKGRYIFGRQEPTEFLKIVNTVARAGKDYKVFMAGNPDHEIEHCPYIEGYHLIFDHMENGTVYTFDSGNTAIVKLAKQDGDDTSYIVDSTRTMFGRQDDTSHIGVVDRPKTVPPPPGFEREFIPAVEIKVETATIAIDGPTPYRRCIWLYVGIYRGTRYLAVMAHRRYYRVDQVRMVAVYNPEDVPPPDGTAVYMYRLNIPQSHLWVERHINDCLTTRRVYHETDRTASILRDVVNIQ